MAQKKEEGKKEEPEEEATTEEATAEPKSKPRLHPNIHTVYTVMSPKRRAKTAPPTGPGQAYQNLNR